MPPKTPNLKGAEPPEDTQVEARERRQAIATIITNWGQAFSTLNSWMHMDTWLQGSTERMTEFTCDMPTIRAFRDLSRNTVNRGQEVKDQIEQYYIMRYHNKGAGPIGNTKEKKMGYICEDLRKLLANNFIDPAKFKPNNTKKRPAAAKGAGKKPAARKKTKRNNATATPNGSDDQDEDDTITSEVEEEDTVVPESDEAEDDESRPAPNPKPVAKPADNGTVNEFRRRLRSHGRDEAEKGAQQTEREKSNPNEVDDDDDTSSIFSEPPEAETIHTSDDKDEALARIYSNWQIVSLHKDFPAMLRGSNPDAPEDTGIEDVIIELLRDLSERFPTKRQGKKISEELALRFKRMRRYNLKAVYQAITATARSYRWASVSEDSLGLSGDEGDADEQGLQPEAGDANDQAPQSEAAPRAARPNKQRRYAARSHEASDEMQAAWDAVVVAEAAVRVAQDKRVRAALRSETEYQQATRQLRVSEAQLRAAEECARARSLGRSQRVGETVGPSGDERGQRRRGDVAGVEEGREQNQEGGAGEGGDDGVDVRVGAGNGEGDEEGTVA